MKARTRLDKLVWGRDCRAMAVGAIALLERVDVESVDMGEYTEIPTTLADEITVFLDKEAKR